MTGDDAGAKVARVVADGIAADGATFSDDAGLAAVLGFSTPGISVADASATEGPDATLEFTVTLEPAASEAVSVTYATADGTGEAGKDYTGVTGTVRFAAGETSKTVPVRVLDDIVQEAGETFSLVLGDPQGAHAYLARTRATGTITPPAPLTAAFEGAPAAHGGAPFVLRLRFSAPVPMNGEVLVDQVLSVTNGRVTRAHRPDRRDSVDTLWELTVEPTPGDVTVALPVSADCAGAGAVCTRRAYPVGRARA